MGFIDDGKLWESVAIFLGVQKGGHLEMIVNVVNCRWLVIRGSPVSPVFVVIVCQRQEFTPNWLKCKRISWLQGKAVS